MMEEESVNITEEITEAISRVKRAKEGVVRANNAARSAAAAYSDARSVAEQAEEELYRARLALNTAIEGEGDD